MLSNKTESIGDIIRRFLREEGLETPLNEHRAVAAWPVVMGEAINNHTGNIFIRGGVMNVQIKSPALRQDLLMNRTILAQRINEYVGAQVITELRLY